MMNNPDYPDIIATIDDLAFKYATYLDTICDPNRIEDFDCDKFSRDFYIILKKNNIVSAIYWTDRDRDGYFYFVNVVQVSQDLYRIYDFTQNNPLVAILKKNQLTSFLKDKYGGIWRPKQESLYLNSEKSFI